MAREQIPEDVRRFILTSIPSVPYLEAMLLLRDESGRAWDSKRVAQRLYMSEKAAAELLSELHAAQILSVEEERAPAYRYQPAADDLRQMIDRLAAAYATNLVDVSTLIHSKTSKKAQYFADAFKLRKDS
jgi:hypothetical protein